MLDVYTFRLDRPPPHEFDLSGIPLSTFTQHAMSIYDHHTSGRIWFGYLEGWMLTPQEEAVLRKVLRKFSCSLVTAFPHSLSPAWKNEIRTLYTSKEAQEWKHLS